MSDADLCRHCGFKRGEHEPLFGARRGPLACPRGMGVAHPDEFDSVPARALHEIPAVDARHRKDSPLFAGCLHYFPDALLAVARLSKIGNDKHNPGEPLHWDKGKSADHADCLARHLIDHGKIDPDTGLSHTVAVAWRALALLQTEIEAATKGGCGASIPDRMEGDQ